MKFSDLRWHLEYHAADGDIHDSQFLLYEDYPGADTVTANISRYTLRGVRVTYGVFIKGQKAILEVDGFELLSYLPKLREPETTP